ncbi:MAG: LacI family DNA-binding transcriptional regulator, partial [Catenulisporales bacterium]|nr:LacI family DNA-binding transcriptional regulator [Catenulisporales bacterium]
MVDIRELARRSGVSPATVSRALNDRAEVSPQTRRRVLELAEELGYSPNQPARTLVRRRSDMIGLIWDTGYTTQNRRQPFLLDLFIGIKQTLAESGHQRQRPGDRGDGPMPQCVQMADRQRRPRAVVRRDVRRPSPVQRQV